MKHDSSDNLTLSRYVQGSRHRNRLLDFVRPYSLLEYLFSDDHSTLERFFDAFAHRVFQDEPNVIGTNSDGDSDGDF